LQFNGQRYYDPLVGGYTQPNAFGGIPGAPQSLNRFGPGSGLSAIDALLSTEGSIPPLAVDIGTTLVLNTVELLQNKEARQTPPAPSRELGDRCCRYPFLNARIDNSQD